MKIVLGLIGLLSFVTVSVAQEQTMAESYAQDYCINEFCPTHIFDEKYKGLKLPYWSACFKDCCHEMSGCGVDNSALVQKLD
jgi:hypothetical protein